MQEHESRGNSASKLKRSCVLAHRIDRDPLSGHGSRLLNAGELGQRQTWASRSILRKGVVEKIAMSAASEYSLSAQVSLSGQTSKWTSQVLVTVPRKMRELLNNGDARTPNGEYRPFPGLWTRDGTYRRLTETHESRAFGWFGRFAVN
jgi:hypothetical protein